MDKTTDGQISNITNTRNPNNITIRILEETIDARIVTRTITALKSCCAKDIKSSRSNGIITMQLDVRKLLPRLEIKPTRSRYTQTMDIEPMMRDLMEASTSTTSNTTVDNSTQTDIMSITQAISTSTIAQDDTTGVNSNLTEHLAIKRKANTSLAYPIDSKRDKQELDIVYNENAILNISGIVIPTNVLLIISLGPSFVKPIMDIDEIQMLSDISKISCENGYPHISNNAINKLLDLFSKWSHKPNPNQRHMVLTKYIDETVEFLRNHSDLMVDVSDKGKKSIIMNRQDYLEKVYGKLSDVTVYKEISVSSHTGHLKRNHTLLEKCCEQGFITSKGVLEASENETQYARMYGLIKAHKEGYPVRVINAKLNSIGTKLTSIITGILNKLNENEPFNILNTHTLIESLKRIKLIESDRLFTADIVDMFTNISSVEALDIIKNKSIPSATNMTQELFIEIFNFVTLHATEFVFNEQKYKMIKGLPMGSGSSPVIASLVTTHWMNQCLKTIDTSKIKFIGKYVDDIIVIGEPNEIEKLFAVFNTHRDLQFKIGREINNSIDYLDITIVRQHDHILTKWFAKPYASLRLINWNSHHDRSQSVKTAKQFITSMFKYSDRIYFEEIEYIAHKVLHLNSFPIGVARVMIDSIIQNDNIITTPKEAKTNIKYIGTSAPWDLLTKMNKSMDKFFNGNLKFVNKVHPHNLKGMIFSHDKGNDELELLNNIVVEIECKTCRFHYVTAITTPIKLFITLKLKDDKHPFHGIRQHIDKAKHAGFEHKILYKCVNKSEANRVAELVSIRKKTRLETSDITYNSSKIIEFAQNKYK